MYLFVGFLMTQPREGRGETLEVSAIVERAGVSPVERIRLTIAFGIFG